MHESGMLQNIKEEWNPNIANGDCQSNEAESLTMEKLVFPFTLLLIAIMASCVIVSVEVLYFKVLNVIKATRCALF